MHTKLLNRDSTQKAKMRKYYQLALALVCMVSVVTLLFYRHEYYRLRYVLEVLNFFGKTGSNGVDPCMDISSNFTLQGKSRPSFIDPLPSWQRLSDNHYIYSAFWENTEENQGVHAISVGVGEPNPKVGCLLWYESLDEPATGKFTYSEITNAVKSKASITQSFKAVFNLYCMLAVNDKGLPVPDVPYGVTFYAIEDKVRQEAYVPVQFSVSSSQNIATFCIAPPIKGNIRKQTIVEFLSYHQLLGVSEFIIYNSGPISRVASALTRSLIHDLLGVDISVLPWNFPFSSSYDVSRTAIEHDCLLRTGGKSRLVGIFDWEEYIVPKYHNSLSVMLDDLGKSASLFKLSELTFCTKLPDNPQIPEKDLLILRKSFFIPNPGHVAYIHQPDQTKGATQIILPGIAVVHRYTHCSQEQFSASKDNPDATMARFSSDMNKSRLLRVWRSGKLFDFN